MDDGIESMKKADLVDALKSLKAKGVKLNTSGNVAELRTRLYQARQSQNVTIAASPACEDGRPTATVDHAKVDGVHRVLLETVNIHPITKICLEKLGFHLPQAPTLAASPVFTKLVQPIDQLVDTLLDACESFDDLNSSPSVNFAILMSTMRKLLSNIHVSLELKPLFDVFKICIHTSDRCAEEYEHIGVIDDVNLSHNLANQVVLVQQAIDRYLKHWMKRFPPPEKRMWPSDFDREEQGQIRKFIREFARERKSGIDPKVATQPNEVIERAVKDILGMDGFPVADAKNETIITSVLRQERLRLYNYGKQNELRHSKKVSSMQDEASLQVEECGRRKRRRDHQAGSEEEEEMGGQDSESNDVEDDDGIEWNRPYSKTLSA